MDVREGPSYAESEAAMPVRCGRVGLPVAFAVRRTPGGSEKPLVATASLSLRCIAARTSTVEASTVGRRPQQLPTSS